jgi:hypothetical protein
VGFTIIYIKVIIIMTNGAIILIISVILLKAQALTTSYSQTMVNIELIFRADHQGFKLYLSTPLQATMSSAYSSQLPMTLNLTF